MTPDRPPSRQAACEQVRLSARERRVWARLERDLAPLDVVVSGPVVPRSAAEPGAERPVGVALVLLLAGLGALVGGAVTVSTPVVVVGAVLSLGSLASAAPHP